VIAANAPDGASRGDSGGGVRGARSGAPTCRHWGRRVGPHPRDQP